MFFQRGLGVCACWHAGGVAHSNAFYATLQQIFGRGDFQAALFGRNQHQQIERESFARLRADEILRGGFVHGGKVGGGEHVHGCALRELLQQRA